MREEQALRKPCCSPKPLRGGSSGAPGVLLKSRATTCQELARGHAHICCIMLQVFRPARSERMLHWEQRPSDAPAAARSFGHSTRPMSDYGPWMQGAWEERVRMIEGPLATTRARPR